MKFIQPLEQGEFQKRESRFAAIVIIKGKEEYVHVPNSGRMKELLVRGAKVYLRGPVDNIKRKTRYSMAMVDTGKTLVSVESAGANLLFQEAIQENRIDELRGYRVLSREITYGRSRFDFLLEDPEGRPVYAEIKSVSLVEGSCALFPDAPTSRGRKHLEELACLARKGISGLAFFVIQRSDALSFTPHRERDPDFSSALVEAYENGVGILAYSCHIDTTKNYIQKAVDVIL